MRELGEKCPVCGKRPVLLADSGDPDVPPTYYLKHECSMLMWAGNLPELREHWRKRNAMVDPTIGRSSQGSGRLGA